MEYEILDFYHIFNVAYILSRFFIYIDIKAYQFYLKYVILMETMPDHIFRRLYVSYNF